MTTDEQTQNLKVGDIIRLTDDQMIPADCIILQTDSPNADCFVQTGSLDGERNLKPKQGIKTIN
jgi:P-type E1-E2 ATPase